MVSGFASVDTIAVNRGKEVSRDLAEGPFFGFLRQLWYWAQLWDRVDRSGLLTVYSNTCNSSLGKVHIALPSALPDLDT